MTVLISEQSISDPEAAQPLAQPLPTPESSPRPSPEVIAHFKAYILQGGQMIKDGKYTEALQHFRNKAEFAKTGRHIFPATAVYVHEIPGPEDYASLIYNIASNTFHQDWKSIELSGVYYFDMKSNDPPRELTLTLPPQLQHEICLMYMEEWLHILQNLQGKPLAGEAFDEVDVAAYMEENGIPLTTSFLSRYGRAKALQKAKQVKKE